MSEIYVLEPPTHGKVIVHTTHGPLDIVLWSKETPKACRNFVQLCVDGYYDDSIFHLVMKNFLVQTGDPTGTGFGGESIYGNDPFPLEIHTRLMYRYRGLVGLASLASEEDNERDPEATRHVLHGSQFFITLAPASGLNQKNTLFGKVTGDSLYNLLSLAECPVDKKYRPFDPPRIKFVEVIVNPFPSMTPRPNSKAAINLENQKKQMEEQRVAQAKPQREALRSRKKTVLSFEVDGSSEESNEEAPVLLKEQISGLPSANASTPGSMTGSISASTAVSFDTVDASSSFSKSKNLQLLKERVNAYEEKAFSCKTGHVVRWEDEMELEEKESSDSSETASSSQEELRVVKEKRSSRKKVLETLQNKIISFKKGLGTVQEFLREQESVQDADLLTDKQKRCRLYLNRRDQKHKKQKQLEVLAKLKDFEQKLRNEKKESKQDNMNEAEDSDWYTGEGLRFAVDSARAYEIDASKDTLMVFDPLSIMTEKAAQRLKNIQRERLRPSLKRSSTLL